jgi:hypothetical protein
LRACSGFAQTKAYALSVALTFRRRLRWSFGVSSGIKEKGSESNMLSMVAPNLTRRQSVILGPMFRPSKNFLPMKIAVTCLVILLVLGANFSGAQELQPHPHLRQRRLQQQPLAQHLQQRLHLLPPRAHRLACAFCTDAQLLPISGAHGASLNYRGFKKSKARRGEPGRALFCSSYPSDLRNAD